MQVLATAGHVDHGKSTLIRALTGIEPDRWEEERRRGMTLDLGFAWTTLPTGAQLAFVDVPGHERFVPTMLAGVGPVPAVLLVVAADEGWRQQTEEHVRALDAWGVRHGVLAVTRADLADPAEAIARSRSRLAGTSLSGIEAVAVSGVTGAGLDELRAALGRVVARLPVPDPAARLRLWVDRAFVIRGAGTVVTGTLPAGRLRVGDEVVVARTGRRAQVRGLQSCGQPVEAVEGVSRVAVNLRGVEVGELDRGDALVRGGEWAVGTEVDVRLEADIAETTTWTVHVGAAAVPARWRGFPGDGEAVLGRLRLAVPVPVAVGDRMLVRDPSRHDVIVAADVLDPRPPALRGRGASRRRAEDLRTGRRGLLSAEDARRLGVPLEDVTELTPGWFADPEVIEELAERLRAYVAETRERYPLGAGPTLDEARAALHLPDSAVVAALVRPPVQVAHGRLVDGSASGLPQPVARAVAEVRAALERDPFAPPDADRLRELGLGARELAAAERLGLLRRIEETVVLLPDAVELAAQRLAQLPQPFTASQAKVALGTTRRVAIPLLEVLDREGVTRRLPDGGRRLATPS